MIFGIVSTKQGVINQSVIMFRLRCITIIILVITCNVDPETVSSRAQSYKGWQQLPPETYPEVLDVLQRAFHKPKIHRTFNQVTPLKINVAATKVGVQPTLYGATFGVDFKHSDKNPGCLNFIAAVQLGKNQSNQPFIENWSCHDPYNQDPFNFEEMVNILAFLVPDG